jgi:viroplasmin and RNaseH domain-containing protein
MNKKFYVVWVGRKTGIFDNWDDCETQVKGYSGSKFKSFKNKIDAEQAFNGVSTLKVSNKPITIKVQNNKKFPYIERNSKGEVIYRENEDSSWIRYTWNENHQVIYFINSNGVEWKK